MPPVRIAMLGAGFIAAFRAQVYRRLEGVELVSVLGRSRERTEGFAARAGIGHAATSWEGLLAGPGFDAVDLCLPNDLHLEFGLLAAAAGKHILCEKPLARTAAEARQMLAAVEKAGVLHAYGENMLHAPDFREILEILADGVIGRPLWLRGKEAHFGPHSDWFWQRSRSGGGALIDMGCHLIGVFNAILGTLPEAVLAFAPTLHHATDCEDAVLALLRYPANTVGQCEASWIQRGGMQVALEICGTEGMLTYDRSGLSQPIKVFARNTTGRYFSEKVEHDRGWLFPTVDEYRRYGYEDQIREFVHCIRSGTKPRCGFADGLAVNRIMDACYDSARAGGWRALPA
ncbi:MAG: Gfo/Idh/MocA family oxidoreductase [Acetobacteraceae bacterium]|nr:Gfo/Idh/MocA family oxidoreductase [Acetobacteraceae bacterium]